MKALKQASGEHLRIRKESARGYIAKNNYVYATFQSMDANGEVRFQGLIASKKPVISADGKITNDGGDAEWFGFSVTADKLAHIAYDPKKTAIENFEAKALPAVEIYLKEFNDVTFTTETI